MNISKISFAAFNQPRQINNTKPQIKEYNNTTKSINLNNSPSFFGSTFNFAPMDEQTFVQKGGSLKFGFARTDSNSPYSGRMVNNSKNMQVVSTYYNGEKTSVNISWSQRDDMDDIFIHLKKDSEINNVYGGKTFVWANETSDIEYMEEFNPDGNLVHSSLIGYKGPNDNTTVMHVQREYEDDGITPYREQTDVGETFSNLFGYTTRISERTSNGTKETHFDTTSKDKTRQAERRVIFYNKDAKPYRSIEDNVTYFDSATQMPYAKAEKRTVNKNKNGVNVIRDFGFETTDYNQGAGPIRKFMYEEHPYTIRKTEGDTKTFYDGVTRKRFAIEHHKDGKMFPDVIVNFDKMCAAEIREFATNTIFMDIYKDFETKISSMLFQRKGNNFAIKQVDIFDPATEQRSITRRFFPDGSITTLYYDEEGRIINSNKQLQENNEGEN